MNLHHGGKTASLKVLVELIKIPIAKIETDNITINVIASPHEGDSTGGTIGGNTVGGNTTTSCTHNWSGVKYHMLTEDKHQVCYVWAECTICGEQYYTNHEEEACVRDSSGVCIYCENDGTYVS